MTRVFLLVATMSVRKSQLKKNALIVNTVNFGHATAN